MQFKVQRKFNKLNDIHGVKDEICTQLHTKEKGILLPESRHGRGGADLDLRTCETMNPSQRFSDLRSLTPDLCRDTANRNPARNGEIQSHDLLHIINSVGAQ